MNLESLFEKAIKRIEEGQLIYQSEILTTTAGQKFKIIIHQLVWYTVILFVEVDPRLATDDLFVRFEGLSHIEQINVSEHTALVGAQKKLDQVKKDILESKPPNFIAHLKDERIIYHHFYLKVRQGKKVLLNPDGYFTPGDNIQIDRGTNRYSAIYIGDKKLIQVLPDKSEGAEKDDAIIEEVEWEKFHGGDSKFFICDSIFRMRTNEEIVKVAKSKIGNYKGKYSYLSKSFANSCQFGEKDKDEQRKTNEQANG